MNCLQCGNEIMSSTRIKFCSNECKVKFHSINRPSKKQEFEHRHCLFCGKEFIPTRNIAKFCSRKCKETYRNRNKPSTATKIFGKSYLEANKLKENHLVADEYQTLIGCLLGDGTIVKTAHGFRFSMCHAKKQLPYLLWKKEQLPNLIMAHPTKYQSYYKGYPTVQFHLHSIHHPQLEQIYHLFYKDGVKTITMELLNQLEPLAIAVWYMDDGSFNSNPNSLQVIWSTDSFTKEENELIIDWFMQTHGIEIKLQYMKNNHTSFGGKPSYRLRINRTKVDKFFDLIRPYIHPTMLYKIK